MRCFDLLFVFSLYFSNLPIITNNQLGNLWLTILLYMMIHSDSVQSIRTNANPDKDKAQRYGEQNINKQPYLNSDYVLYIAGKQLRDYGYCFAIIDVKARHIVSHFYKATPPNLADMIDCLSSVIKETSFLPNVKFIDENPASLNKYFDKLNVLRVTGPLNQIVRLCEH